MKRWADFERDRRYRSGSHSRDSTYDNLVQRSGSPQRAMNDRYSVISSAETYQSASGGNSTEALYRRGSPAPASESGQLPGPRRPQQLELPAPLSSQGGHSGGSSNPESFEDFPAEADASRQHLAQIMQSPQSVVDYPQYPEYDSDENLVNSPNLSSGGGFDTATVPSRAYAKPDRELMYSPELERSGPTSGRQSVSSPDQARSDSVASHGSNPFVSSSQGQASRNNHRRGISLIDDGPVPGSQGFRVVQRARRSSQGPGTPGLSSTRSRNSLAPQSGEGSSDGFASPTNTASRTTSPSLPPGAAPSRRPS